jgi:hypothetical protein
VIRRHLAAVVLAVLVVGCGRPDLSHYQAVLDELVVPAGWEQAREAIKAPDGPDPCASLLPECPSVTRYYLVLGTAVDAYPSVKQMVTDAGFGLDLDTGPACDLPPGSNACALAGTRGDDKIRVTIYKPGSDVTELGTTPADRTIVVVGATR